MTDLERLILSMTFFGIAGGLLIGQPWLAALQAVSAGFVFWPDGLLRSAWVEFKEWRGRCGNPDTPPAPNPRKQGAEG